MKQTGRSIVDYERIYEHLSIDDPDDPHSLINIAPSIISEKIKSIPKEYFDLGEEEITNKAGVKALEDKLRTSFWLEYVRAIRTEEKMNAPNIFAGVCTLNDFRKCCESMYKLLYIIRPRPDFHVEIESMLLLGMRRMREVLECEPIKYNADGDVVKIDHKLIAHQRGIYQNMIALNRPAEPKKMEIEAKHLHASIPVPQDMNAINARLAELDKLEAPKQDIIQQLSEVPIHAHIEEEDERSV
jgi:hypothetical protein